MPELGPSPLIDDEDHLSVDAARAAIHAQLRPVTGTETVALDGAVGRVLAADLASPIDVPAHDNSAMDGFAYAGGAMHPGVATPLRCVATVYAGAPYPGTVATGDCVRIMTGAVMPAGTDTVVPQELCSVAGDRVTIAPDTVAPGENRRRRGEDLAAGRAALAAGRVLQPADIGLAASLGIAELTVVRRLRVALFSTGNELRTPGQPLAPGCIYDSNRASLRAALQRLGVDVVDLGLVADDRGALETALGQALSQADAVLTSGGVSVGDADYTRDVLARLGEVAFWKVAMRPGRPFAFGALRRTGDATAPPAFLFALPGNPVAALVTFYAFARDALRVLAGAQPLPRPVLQARSVQAIRKRPGRTEFQRAVVEPGAKGWQVRLTGSQGAGVLRSMSEANALVVLGHDRGSVAAGEMVDVWLFEGLV